MPYETRSAALSEGQRGSVFGTDLPSTVMQTEGGYVLEDGLWWSISGRQVFDATRFYIPTQALDPFGNATTVTYDTHDLFVASLTDAVGNVVSATHDYRVLAPVQLTDANGNRTAVGFDTRGAVAWTAVMGKVGAGEGDTETAPTTEHTYDLFAWRDRQEPPSSYSRARETHGDPTTRWLEQWVYVDGSGTAILTKANAEPGDAPQRDVNGDLVLDGNGDPILVHTDPRYVGTGRTVFDNKGNPVKQYDPYFSSTSDYEDEVELREQGVTPLLHYDPLGRLRRTDFPDSTFATVEVTPWSSTTADRNDNASGTTWETGRLALPAGDPERRAAELTADHHDTPTVVHLDPLGRPVRSITHNKDAGGVDEFAETRTVLDIQGNALEVIDARGNTAEEREYGMAGQALLVDSEDAGERRSLADVVGNPLRGFDERGFVRRFEYDALLRPTHAWVTPSGGTEFLVMRTAYGELVTSPQTLNLRGRAYRTYDGAGVSTNDEFDFKGNVLTTTRQLALTYTTTPDWTALAAQTTIAGLATAAAGSLEAGTFVIETTYDGLNRPLTQTTPDSSEVQLTYNDAGLLDAVDARVRGAGTATAFIDNIDYDVRGRRERIEYSNGTVTTYAYDEVTQRLTDLRTTRTSDSAVMQDLHYTYDPVGNITEIEDAAQQTVYFQNAVVSPDQRFEYDALYRLRRAEGREHTSLSQPTDSDLAFGAQPHPDDPSALRTYAQEYVFDVVGNLLQMQHTATGGNFTRQYTYAAGGNRLLSNSAPGESTAPFSHTYSYDVHGNMTSMPHLAAMDWDHADRLQHCDLGGGGDVYFLYDAGGTRVRKVQVNVSGSQATERVYIGPYEVYRERAVSAGVLQAVDLQRQTLHISDDTGRLCMVETKTIEFGSAVGSPVDVFRFQYANHLGTAALELDGSAAVISYEEFHPFGTTSYAAADSAIEVSAKRYRYIGKERDEETGLYHCGARYLAAWLGRWTAADPIGLGDGVNRYAYSGGNPISYKDTGGSKKQPAMDETSRRLLLLSERETLNAKLLDVNARLGRLDALERGVKNFKRDVGARRARLQGAEKEVARAKSGVQRNAFVLSRRGAAESKRATPLSGQDVRDFAERVGRAVEETGRAIGGTTHALVEPLAGRPAAKLTALNTEALSNAWGGTLTGGVGLAGATTEIPGDVAAAEENVVEGAEAGDAAQVGVGVLQGIKAAGTVAALALTLVGGAGLAKGPVKGPGSGPTSAGGGAPSGGGSGYLVRFGKGPETAAELAADAAKAEAGGFPHGVSTKAVDKVVGSDKRHRSAPRADVEAVFKVEQTGGKAHHHTVHLPKPVTEAVAEAFNRLFKPKP